MNFADRDGFIWFDGKMVPWREANVHVLTHSLHYGMGCFEGVRAYATSNGPAIFRLQEHTRRLFRSAHILQMPMAFDQETINQAQIDVVKANELESGYLRPLVFYGSEGMGLHAKTLSVHVAIAGWSWGTYLGDAAINEGIRVKTSSYSRHYVNAAMSKAKATGQYINSILAVNEASAAGYDEALILDTEGYVAEGSGENIFMVRDGEIYTPEVTSALPGITRQTINHLANEFGIPVHEKRMTRDEFYICDEAFFVGTAVEVTPIRELDDRKIGSGSRGPITEKLQTAYFDLVHGRKNAPTNWLTFVNGNE